MSIPAYKDLAAAGGTQIRLADWRVILCVVVLALAWFGTLDYRKLYDPDEGRFSEMPRAMVANGDFVTPRLNGLRHYDKPPFQYWLTAGAFAAFGVHEWTARLVPAIAGFLGLMFVGHLGARLFGVAGGLAAAAMLGSGLYYLLFSQFLTVDMSLTLCITVALGSLMLGLLAPEKSAEERGWMLLGYAAMGCGVLTKGLIAVAIPGLVLTVYLLLDRRFRILLRLHLLPGIVLLLAITVPWFVVVSTRNPDFLEYFFIREHFQRFATRVHKRSQPFPFFFVILLVGTLPWTWLIIEGVRNAFRRRLDEPAPFRPLLFLALWGLCVTLFFSLSRAKMLAYVLPAVPPFALLAAARMLQLDPARLRRRVVPALLAMLAVVVGGSFVMLHAHRGDAHAGLYEAYARWLWAAGGVLALGAALVWRAQRSMMRLVTTAAATALAAGLVTLLGFESLSPLNSGYIVAEEIRRNGTPQTVVFSVQRADYTVAVYLGRTTVLVEPGGQLRPGAKRDPERVLESLPEFAEAWRVTPDAMAVMRPDAYRDAVRMGVPMRVIYQDRTRVLVGQPTQELPPARPQGSSAGQRVEQLLVDAAEAAVAHHQDMVAAAARRDDGSGETLQVLVAHRLVPE